MSIIKCNGEAINDILIRLTFDGAFQRAKIYKENTTALERETFRRSMALLLPITLNEILAKEKYSNNDHFKILEKFSNIISKKHEEILIDDKIRIGNAQKFLNLYWKVSWLIKKNIPIPIHCPFDSIVIKKLDKSLKGTAWTKFDSIDVYKKLVAAAEEKAGAISHRRSAK